MTPPIEWASCLFNLSLLRCASLMVPHQQRVEWWREWHAELWHVRRICSPAGTSSWGGEREVAAFCMGAFQDALYLKRQFREKGRTFAPFQGSPAQCILLLAAVMAASYAIALMLPGVRSERILSQRPVSPGLLLIQNAANSNDSLATILPGQYRAWKRQKQAYFDGFAFYRVSPELVRIESPSGGSQQVTGWAVARASSNLFALLGLPVQFQEENVNAERELPKVILSEAVWKKEFGANPDVVGSIMRFGQGKVIIAGVTPDSSWGLPGKVDAWLLEPDSEMAAGGAGFIVAHLTPLGAAEMWRPRVPITAFNSNQSEDDLTGVSLDEGIPPPWSVFVFTVILAFLALPATTSVSLGEYSLCSQRPTWWRRFCRWGLLGAKIGLLLSIVFFISLDMAYGCTTISPTRAIYIQLVSSFSICLLGMNWVLRDHRQRCPVCLHRVAHPAQVGQASRTFLAWNGTELMCMGGHTLLHVPGLPTSWFNTQRWMYLDTSWEFLFAGPRAGAEPEFLTGLGPLRGQSPG